MRAFNLVIAALLAAGVVGVAAAADPDAAPMPQTKGMQGMDPALHDQWAKEGEQDPYKDCKPNPEKAAVQERHPMPQTKGMQGMDAKAHTVDCAQAPAAKADKPRHVHKQ